MSRTCLVLFSAVGFGAGGSVLLQLPPGSGRGNGTYGWGGAAGTIFWIDTKNQVRVSAMINRFLAVGSIDSQLIQAVYNDLKPGSVLVTQVGLVGAP